MATPSSIIPIGDLPISDASEQDYLITTSFDGHNAYRTRIPQITTAAELVDDAIQQVIDNATAQANVVLSGLGYLPPVDFTSGLAVNSQNFTVAYEGTVYAPAANSVPFTTTSTFNPSQWRVIQGIAEGDIYNFVRRRLSSHISLYVATSGSNSNTGLSPSSPFATIQRAVDEIKFGLDLNSFSVTINIGNGAYSAGASLSGEWIGGDQVYIIGNLDNPAAVDIHASGDVFYAEKGATVDVRGVKTSSDSGRGFTAFTGAFISVGKVEYGEHTGAAHNEVGTGGNIILSSDYTISGGGASHFHAGSEGQIRSGNIVATIGGNPNFSAYFAGAAQGSIILQGWTWTGTATGARYLAHKNGTIETHPGLNPGLPGSIEGRTAWGGVYMGSNSIPMQVATNTATLASLNMQVWEGNTSSFRTIMNMTVDPSGVGLGWGYFNGAGSYFSDLCHFGTATQVLMGNTTDGVSISKGGEMNQSVTGGAAQYIRRQGSDGTMVQFWRDTIASGSISSSLGATAFNTTSDENLKDWLGQNYDPEWIEKVGAEIGDFTFNNLPDGASNPVRTGVRAQRLHKIDPLAVTPGHGNKGDVDYSPWGVDYSALIPKLILEVLNIRKRQSK